MTIAAGSHLGTYEILAPLGRAAPNDHLFDVAGFHDGLDLKCRLPAGTDDAENFAVGRRQILGGDAARRAGAQTAQELHIDDRLNGAALAVIKGDGIGGAGIRA